MHMRFWQFDGVWFSALKSTHQNHMFCLRLISCVRSSSSTVGRALQTLYFDTATYVCACVYAKPTRALSFISVLLYSFDKNTRGTVLYDTRYIWPQAAKLPMKWHFYPWISVQRRIHPPPPPTFTCSLSFTSTVQYVVCTLFATGTYQFRSTERYTKWDARARSLSIPQTNQRHSIHRHEFQTTFTVNEFQFRGEIQSE